MAFTVKRFKEIIEDMVAYMIANQDKLSDFNQGSAIMTFFEAVGLEIEQLYIRGRVGFGKALKETPFEAFNFEREGAIKASGNIIFSRSGTSGTVSIPSGTLISTEDGTQFETTAAGEISDGNSDSSAIAISAIDEGTDGNVPASTIIIMITPITGVDSCNNTSSTSGGQNQETEAEYMQRFQEFIEGLGQSNVSGLIAGAKSVEGVRSASGEEHFPPDSGYNITVYIDDGAGNAPQALIDSVEDVIIGDGTTSNPGYKAGGINARVLAPTKINIDVTVVITDDGTVDQDSVETLVEAAISDYVNNLLIGEDVILNELRKYIMQVDGVYDIAISVPSSNTTINDGQIARTNTITISFA